ncbi:MAG: ATP-binding protein [Faecousia sp.]
MRKLRTQLSAGFALIVLATVALISLVSNVFISRQFEQYITSQQKIVANDLANGLVFPYDPSSGTWNQEYIHGFGMYALNDGYMIKLHDVQGNVVWDAENHDMTLCHKIMEGISLRMEQTTQGSLVTQVYPLKLGDVDIGSAEIRYYTPYYTDENAFQFLDALNLILLVVGLVSLLGAVLSGILLSKHICAPILRTTQVTGQIAQGNYAIRLSVHSHTREVEDLTDAVNHMAQTLEYQQRLRKQLTMDVAHELRTPLTNVSTHLEMLLEGVWEPSRERLQRCYDELCRMSQLVSDLQRLHEAEQEDRTPVFSDVDLLALAKAAAADFEGELAAKNLECSVTGDSCVVAGEEGRLQQVAANLLSNAVKYTGVGGHIRLAVKDAAEYGVLTVEDDGIGIPESDLSLIFERFYRTDRSRSRKTGGVGIGLTIVKAIVTAHGGQVSAENRPEGGSRFTVSLPKSQ